MIFLDYTVEFSFEEVIIMLIQNCILKKGVFLF